MAVWRKSWSGSWDDNNTKLQGFFLGENKGVVCILHLLAIARLSLDVFAYFSVLEGLVVGSGWGRELNIVDEG